MKFFLETGRPEEAISWDDTTACADAKTAAFEMNSYFLRIESPPVDAVNFRLKVGDEFIPVSCQCFSGQVEIERKQLFESAAGKTILTVSGFDKYDNELFSISQSIYVIPSKIGKDNYQRMVDDLNAICHALLNDLLGKSKHGKIWDRFKKHSFRSHEEELIAIQRMWKRFSVDLRMITAAPQGRLSRKNVVVLPHGKNLAHYRTQRRMLQQGAPVSSDLGKRLVSRLEYSMDTAEHRLLKKFIKILQLRVSACLKGICNSIDELLVNGVFRKQSFGANKSLFETEDMPRIKMLENKKREAGILLNLIEQQLRMPFWDDVSEELFVPGPDRFIANQYYKHAAFCIFQFLQNGFYWNDSSSLDFKTKKSSRIYEQWVLINLVNAFEACGLSFVPWEQIINDALNSQYNMDFQRGTQFLCNLSPEYRLSIRYEPWIIPSRNKTAFPDATLYHAEKNNTYWSPDIVLELQTNGSEKSQTVYAITIDCKYSRRIGDDQQQNVNKYLKIRSADSGKQVVGQLWLFYLGEMNEPNAIALEDIALCFSTDRGIHFSDDDLKFEADREQILGYVIAKPSPDENTGQTAIAHVPPVFMDFAKGTIAFFGKHFPIG